MTTHREKCEAHAVVLKASGYARTADARDYTKYCTCCKEAFEPGDEYRTFTSHMHEECIRELLAADGQPNIGSKPPNRILKQNKQTNFTPPVVTPPAAREAIVAELAEKVAEQVDYLTEGSKDEFVKAVADEVIARLKPVLTRWEQAVDRLEEMLTND